MPKTETVLDLLERTANDICGIGFMVNVKDGETPGIIDDVLKQCCVLDYPIVRCGDSRVVLVVDREELEVLLSDLMRHGFKCGKGSAMPGNHVAVTLDLILAKLGLGEVERIMEVQRHKDDSCLLCESSGVEEYGLAYQYGPPFRVALLKPSPASKEESGG